MRKPAFKPSLREMREQSRKGMDFYAAMSGRTVDPFYDVPEKRARAKAGSSGEPLEKDIQKAILQYLAASPAVAWAGRFNRGSAITSNGNGEMRYTKFNTVRGFPDIHGQLVNGLAFWIEVKRKGGKLSDDQRDFIELVSSHGGLAFMAESVDDVRDRIK